MALLAPMHGCSTQTLTKCVKQMFIPEFRSPILVLCCNFLTQDKPALTPTPVLTFRSIPARSLVSLGGRGGAAAATVECDGKKSLVVLGGGVSSSGKMIGEWSVLTNPPTAPPLLSHLSFDAMFFSVFSLASL